MTTYKVLDGPTPKGGVRVRINYMDDEGNPADELQATQCEVLELDSRGEVIARTYGSMGNANESPDRL